MYGCIDLTMFGVLLSCYVIWWSDHV